MGASGGVVGMFINHSYQDGSLCPVRSTRPRFMMRMVVIRKMMLQALSVSLPTDIRDPDVRDGNMCDWRDEAGRLGRG